MILPAVKHGLSPGKVQYSASQYYLIVSAVDEMQGYELLTTIPSTQ